MAALTWPETGPVFRVATGIRFAQCDPAGIVFYPQYLVLFQSLVEDWFNQALHHPYAQMLGPERTGLPIVHLACDFRAIARMGDAVQLELAVLRLGSRSLQLALRCVGDDGQVRALAHQALVFTSLDSHEAIRIPPVIHRRMAAWLAGERFQ
nr:thioesterase family protein [Comamonas koreensis]